MRKNEKDGNEFNPMKRMKHLETAIKNNNAFEIHKISAQNTILQQLNYLKIFPFPIHPASTERKYAKTRCFNSHNNRHHFASISISIALPSSFPGFPFENLDIFFYFPKNLYTDTEKYE